MSDRKPDSGLRVLWRYGARLSGAGKWLLLAWCLAVATLIGSLGLLGLSGWFLSAAAVAGLSPVTAMAFNFFLPGAGVRFFAILRTVSRWGERVVSHEAVFRLITGLRLWLFQRLSYLSPSQLGRRHGGELLNALVKDVDALDNLYPRLLLPLGAAIVVLATAAALAYLLTPWAALLPLALLLVAVLVLPALGWSLGRELSPRLLMQHGRLRRDLLDSIDGLQDFSLHGAAWQEQRARVQESSAAWLGVQAGFVRRGACLRALVAVTTGAATWAALAWLGRAPDISGPWLAALVLVLLGAQEALVGLAGAFLELPGTAAAAARVDQLASQQPEPVFVEQGPEPQGCHLAGAGLSFAWPGQAPLFQHLTFDLPEGAHIAMLGPSGGGKSTLVQLLTRLEDPGSGSIRLGGVDVRELDENTLRRHVVAAGQFPWAQAATLADNLRLADPQATAEQMWHVLRIVGLATQVEAWQDGLETWVEAGGASLSGGQRRRLGLARALLRQASITILDEPAEGLEEAAELALIAEVRAALQGRTLLWITHRPAGLSCFDAVWQLEDGQVHDISPSHLPLGSSQVRADFNPLL